MEDVTLVKLPETGCITIHVRFKGGKTETLTALNPKGHAQRIKTPPEAVALVDELLDNHIYGDIAEEFNARGVRPGAAAAPGHEEERFCAKRVAYIVRAYGLRSRYDRLRDRGMLTKNEMADRLGIHEQTLVSWAKHGIVNRHAYNAHAFLYEDPGPEPPAKHCSRWDRLANRPRVNHAGKAAGQESSPRQEEVQYEDR